MLQGEAKIILLMTGCQNQEFFLTIRVKQLTNKCNLRYGIKKNYHYISKISAQSLIYPVNYK